jgi:hypothetical protein
MKKAVALVSGRSLKTPTACQTTGVGPPDACSHVVSAFKRFTGCHLPHMVNLWHGLIHVKEFGSIQA